MFTTKFRIAALLFLTILMVSAGKIVFPYGAYGEAAPALKAPKVPKEMLGKRLEEAKRVWAFYWQARTSRLKIELSDLFGWSERLLEAELALLDKQEGRIKALKSHVDRTRQIEQIAIAQVESARSSQFNVHKASYERINAEIRYFQETGKIPPPPAKEVLLEPKVEELPLVPPKNKERR